MEKTLKFPDIGRLPMRDYYLRYAVQYEVTNHGEPCEHCSTDGQTVQCNIHATDMSGQPLYAESCLSCALRVLDRELDVDPSFTVTVEVSDE